MGFKFKFIFIIAFFLSLFEGQPIKNENPDLEKVGIFYVSDILKPYVYFKTI
jgi:hypothetical protein